MTIAKDNENLFAVGKIVGFHGLKGDVKIKLVTNNAALFSDVKEAQIRLVNGSVVDVSIDQMQSLGSTLMVRFKQYSSRTEAETLNGGQVFVEKNTLADLDSDEWWFSDLIGLAAYTAEGKLVGTVSAVIDGVTQLIEIKPVDDSQGKVILVPFVKALVPIVDLKNKRLEVSDLPGLLEPQ
jgi:16S rRNA processing protein RimM